VIKIIILEDVVKGEIFKSKITAELLTHGVLLSERHENLHSDDLPKIVKLNEKEKTIEFVLKYESKKYKLSMPQNNQDIFRAGLVWLYGDGMLKHNYKLPIFDDLSKNLIEKYQNLATEIWERNIHLDWMRNHKHYLKHNGSKNAEFVYGIIMGGKDKDKAIKKHQTITDAGKSDTQHHIFRDPKRLRRLIETEGKNEAEHKLLIESIYDQATITTRIWFPDRYETSFEERIEKNKNAGYFCSGFRWKPGVFGFTNAYETKIWEIWVKAHEEFRDYWIDKFGENEEFWQPPKPI